jgi:hypothetical protein
MESLRRPDEPVPRLEPPILSVEWAESPAGTATVSGVTHSTTSWYQIRARLSGTTATTAQVRLWTAGSNEPTTWTLASTDNSTPANPRGSGSTGVYLNAKRALNAYYDDLTLRPIDSAVSTTPTALTGTPVAAGRIDLAWSASTDTVGVAGYNVYRDGAKINTAPVGSISYSDTGLGAGVSHTYAVSAVDRQAMKGCSSTRPYLVDTTQPSCLPETATPYAGLGRSAALGRWMSLDPVVGLMTYLTSQLC